MLKNGNFKNSTTGLGLYKTLQTLRLLNGYSRIPQLPHHMEDWGQSIHVIKGHKYYTVGYVKVDSNTVHIDIAGTGTDVP